MRRPAVPLVLLVALVAAAAVRAPSAALAGVTSCELAVDATALAPFWQGWRECVGSGHLGLAERADWREHLTMAADIIGFKYLRGHGILDNDVMVWGGQQVACQTSAAASSPSAASSPGGRAASSKPLTKTMYNVYRAYDFILSLGMKPIVELSFTPAPVADGQSLVFNYHGYARPPIDLEGYTAIIRNFTTDLIARYGEPEVESWWFEEYNEAGGMGHMNVSQYLTMYGAAGKGVKAACPKCRFGGPASMHTQWLDELVAYCNSTGAPLDFISTHSYPSDPVVSPGTGPRGNAASVDDQFPHLLYAREHTPPDLPLLFTEFSSSPSSRDPYHDTADAAAFVLAAVVNASDPRIQGYGQGMGVYSYWTFSDVFEEDGFPVTPTSSVPYYGGFGLINMYGVPKPTFRAFELLAAAGDTRASMTATPALPSDNPFNSIALVSGANVTVLLWNHACPSCGHLPNATATAIAVNTFPAGTSRCSAAYLSRVDAENANAMAAWEAMSSPDYPSAQQVTQLVAASQVPRVPLPTVTRTSGSNGASGGSVSVSDITVPAHGVAAVTFLFQ